MLLKTGRGIANELHKVDQHTNLASLAIGIGGIGMAALSKLKTKSHQQLIPDAYGYNGIQLLASNSDVTEYRDNHGAGRLQNDEFVCIADPHMVPVYNARAMIAADPRMNWLDLNCLTNYSSTIGAGGIRQIGRCLLLNRANEIMQRLQNKCMQAIMARGSAPLNVFVFVGLSGGTGSDCFLDVCYLLREIARTHHLEIKIHGLFFLSDVILSRFGGKCQSWRNYIQ